MIGHWPVKTAIFAGNMRRLSFAFALAVLLSSTYGATPKGKPGEDENKPLPSIARKTRGMQAMPGYFNLYWDARAGKVWIEISKFDSEFLYVAALAAGVGSNDIGLDRGQFGDLEADHDTAEHVVKFERVGPKVLLVEQNLSYRAVTKDPDEQRSVEEAFAHSVLWGFKVEAEEKDRVLVDATSFLLNDAHGVAEKLKTKKQGTYKVDETRSAIYLPVTKNFPKNTEFEATLTLTGEPTGDWIRSVTPTPNAVTVREHHSFVELPDDQYQPRDYDPALRLFPDELRRLRSADPGSAGQALHRPASPAQEESNRGHERACAADRLLCRSGRAGVDPICPDRGCVVVESGVRVGWLQKGLSGEGTARGDRSAWTCVTTSSNGCTARPAAGRMGRRLSIRALARSSRDMCR